MIQRHPNLTIIGVSSGLRMYTFFTRAVVNEILYVPVVIDNLFRNARERFRIVTAFTSD